MLAANTQSSMGAQKGAKQDSRMEPLTMYLGFMALCGLVWQSFQGIGLSTLPTLSVGMQVLALLFLRVKIMRTGNVRGISAKTLQMQALVHGLRLTSTTWLKGYIPSDETGDWFYQLMDFAVLLMCLTLLHTVLKTHRHTYQEDSDDFDVKPAILVCVFLAVLVHPDLNDRVFFDAIWTTALYVDVMCMVPQLWMMSKIGGDVEALTGHYVAAITGARLVDFTFWYFGYAELAPADGGFNLAGWAIILSQVIQLLLMADFMFYYVKAWMIACCAKKEVMSCCSAPIPMPSAPVEV